MSWEELYVESKEITVSYRKQEVPYIGHVLTPHSLKPDPSKFKAILAMPTPSDKKVLKRLLGMITYLAKFLPNLSDVTEPLRRLLDKDVQWHWNETHEKSWKQVKQLTTMEPVLKYFDPSKEVTLQCDTSMGIRTWCSNIARGSGCSNHVKSTYEHWKKLYSNREGALSIVHGCTRFDQYVYGRQITVQTDHKPLERIFKKSLLCTPKRLRRMWL